MGVWTVWENARHGDAAPLKARFVKDSFSWAAFLFAPLWLLANGMVIVFVALAGVAAGAGLVNDVSGLDFDPAMAAEVARSGAAICLMHAKGLPENMQDDPRYDDVLLDVYDSLADRIARGLDARLEAEKITLADLTGSAADRWAA